MRINRDFLLNLEEDRLLLANRVSSVNKRNYAYDYYHLDDLLRDLLHFDVEHTLEMPFPIPFILGCNGTGELAQAATSATFRP